MTATNKDGTLIPVLLPVVHLENRDIAMSGRVKTGWLLCPQCRKKMDPIQRTTSGVDIPAYCRRCKQRYWVTIK